MESKEAIRKRLLEIRQRLQPPQIKAWSHRIAESLFDLVDEAASVGLYSPVRGEVETEEIFRVLKGSGKTVSYPRVRGDVLDFHVVSDLSELKPGSWGILEPEAGSRVMTGSLDLVVVPGVAFDERCFRIGFGKGFYDRLLSRWAHRAVGLAYECQMVKEIPREATDRPCHWVVTEKRVITGIAGKGG